MQIHQILISLKELAANTPMAEAFEAVGFTPTNIHHGTDATIDAERPFALLNVGVLESEPNSSGSFLVTCQVTLTVVLDEQVELAGKILQVFHDYWDQISGLPNLDLDVADFVQIFADDSDLIEIEGENLARDTLIASTGWTMQLSEQSIEIGA